MPKTALTPETSALERTLVLLGLGVKPKNDT
jgi:hypothetical protein